MINNFYCSVSKYWKIFCCFLICFLSGEVFGQTRAVITQTPDPVETMFYDLMKHFNFSIFKVIYQKSNISIFESQVNLRKRSEQAQNQSKFYQNNGLTFLEDKVVLQFKGTNIPFDQGEVNSLLSAYTEDKKYAQKLYLTYFLRNFFSYLYDDRYMPANHQALNYLRKRAKLFPHEIEELNAYIKRYLSGGDEPYWDILKYFHKVIHQALYYDINEYDLKNVLSFFKNGLKSRSSSSNPSGGLKTCQKNRVVPGVIWGTGPEMVAHCQERLNLYSQMGYQNVVFYYPIHYTSSIQYRDFFYPILHFAHSGKNSVRYFQFGMNDENQFHACLDYAKKKKLKVSFVPHLENLGTLASDHEPFWRNLSGMVLDDDYYRFAVNPIINYFKNQKETKSFGKVDFTFLAELDLTLLNSLPTIKHYVGRLRNEFKQVGIPLRVILNSNGDFNHTYKFTFQTGMCHELIDVLTVFDHFAPSVYEQKGHLPKNFTGKYSEIKGHYINQWRGLFSRMCVMTQVEKRAEVINYIYNNLSMGEFSLGKKMEFYPALLEDLKNQYSSDTHLNLWTIQWFNTEKASEAFNELENPYYKSVKDVFRNYCD